MNNPSISVVTSLYKSENYVFDFYARVVAEVEKIDCNYEIIFVQDGKTDGADVRVKELIKKDNNVLLIELSRNFGHQSAMLAGIECAIGDTVFTIDVDLEEPPESISKFYKFLLTNWENVDAVVGIHEKRDKGSIQRLSGSLFYKIFNGLAEEKIPPNQLWARLMKRKYVDSFLKYKENLRFSAGLFSITGFNQVYLPVKKSYKGSSSYSMLDRISSGMDATTSFSVKPLKYLFVLGFISFIASSTIGVALVMSRLFIDYYSGWLSILTTLIFFGSVNLMAIGVVGVYVSSVYLEVKDRPKYLIRSVYGKS